MSDNTSKCCSDRNCCSAEQSKKQLIIDFLYLDLSVCERCQCTESNLDAAMKEVSTVLKSAGFEIVVNKVNINSKELAIKYEFLSSPTIRINGNDIELEVKETACKECGDLCGDDVDCRVWVYDGNEYTEPPKEMIVNAILKEVYGSKNIVHLNKKEYILPSNLQAFFDGINNKK